MEELGARKEDGVERATVPGEQWRSPGAWDGCARMRASHSLLHFAILAASPNRLRQWLGAPAGRSDSQVPRVTGRREARGTPRVDKRCS